MRAAINLVEDVRRAFIDVLHANQWMDNATKRNAIEKAEKIQAIISYSAEVYDWIWSHNELYKDLAIDSNNLLSNILRIEAFRISNVFSSFHETVYNNESNAVLNSIDVNAFYECSENALCTPLN